VSAKARLDVNVALNRPAYQVSNWGDNPASNANDGSHSTDDVNVGCAISNLATNPWWAVDLGVALYVYGVKFTNRVGSGIYFQIYFVLDFSRRVNIKFKVGQNNFSLKRELSKAFICRDTSSVVCWLFR